VFQFFLRIAISILLLSALLNCRLALASETSQETNNHRTLLIVVGAPGESQFGDVFEKSARLWEKAGHDAAAETIIIGVGNSGGTNDLEQLHASLAQAAAQANAELWLVLLGHGTFDGKEAKFNLRGPDLSASDLAQSLKPIHRPIAIIDTSSSSGPFLNKLSAPGRIVITATRSGYEQNYARFGQYISSAIANPKADLDKDGQVSLLEAFLMAANDVAEFYKTEGRLMTEHPLIDDNGDGFGTPADWFRGVRAVKKATDGAGVDGLRAHQWHLVQSEDERKLSPTVRTRRNELELALEQLHESKPKLQEDDYYQQLEVLLVELARLYETNDAAAH
jgi:hypothetical protein